MLIDGFCNEGQVLCSDWVLGCKIVYTPTSDCRRLRVLLIEGWVATLEGVGPGLGVGTQLAVEEISCFDPI